VCFIEAKVLSDCSSTVTYDPVRNQLARVIENLLCFQANGHVPERLYFTLLTPRFFQTNESSRLYGYKMREYHDHARLLADIEGCKILRRNDAAYHYPDSLEQRLQVLKLNWVAYEDILESIFGKGLDIIQAPSANKALIEYVQRLPELDGVTGRRRLPRPP
jgi:hypothetical protein